MMVKNDLYAGPSHKGRASHARGRLYTPRPDPVMRQTFSTTETTIAPSSAGHRFVGGNDARDEGAFVVQMTPTGALGQRIMTLTTVAARRTSLVTP